MEQVPVGHWYDGIAFGPQKAAAGKFVDWVLGGIGNFLHDLAMILNQSSAEIVTFGVIVCAGGMMIAPMVGSPPAKWFGRLVGIFFIGAIWRALT